jgi:hypothetical protein
MPPMSIFGFARKGPRSGRPCRTAQVYSSLLAFRSSAAIDRVPRRSPSFSRKVLISAIVRRTSSISKSTDEKFWLPLLACAAVILSAACAATSYANLMMPLATLRRKARGSDG